MANRFTCPYCYNEHTLEECKVLCSYNIAGNTTAPCPNKVQRNPDSSVNPRDVRRCMNCNHASKTILCPHIQRAIPRDFLNEISLPIALFGAKATGKSNYIGVLIHEIRKKMSLRFNCSLAISADEESKNHYNQFYGEPLYEAHQVITATDAGETPPLIFPLRFMDKKNNIKNIVTLTFYDTAGENLDSSNSMDVYNQYIANSKGIILLLDPLQVPSTRKVLQAKGVALPQKNTDIETVLSNIVEQIRRKTNIRGNIDIPIALVFTKMDVLEKYGLIDDTMAIYDVSPHEKYGTFIKSHFESCQIDMDGLLGNFFEGDGELTQGLKAFTKVGFFACSALGTAPDEFEQLPEEGPKPKNILDPLIWILAQYKFVTTTKKL